jgi:catechol-2,3-dioxygenase
VTTWEEQEGTAPVIGLSHVQLLVSDLFQSTRWYKDVLGLVPCAEDLEIGYVALRQPRANIVIVLAERYAPRQKSSDDVLDHLALAVTDGDSLSAWAEHLTGLGIQHDGLVLENGHPSLQLRDPDGIMIELVAP